MTDAEIKELARQEQNRYHREWNLKNREKRREINRRYWERRAIRIAEERKAEQATAESYNETQTEV